MKKFLGAATASFIGGVAVLFFQGYAPLGDLNASARQIVVSPGLQRFEFSKNQLLNARRSLENQNDKQKRDRAILKTFTVKNAGPIDIKDIRVLIKDIVYSDSSEIFSIQASAPEIPTDYGYSMGPIVSSSFEDNKFGVISPDKKSGIYDIKLLKSEEQVEIFVLSSIYFNPVATVRNDALNVVYNDSERREEASIVNWFLTIIGAFGLFSLGWVIAERKHRKMLSTVGLDYSEMDKLYKEAALKNV